MKLDARLGPLILDPRQLLAKRNVLDNFGHNISLGIIVLGQKGHHDLTPSGLALSVELGIPNVVEECSEFYELNVDGFAIGALFLGDLQCCRGKKGRGAG